MLLRQLFDSESSTYTYLLAGAGEAVLIDPVKEQLDAYLQLLDELGLRLVLALDTHTHADHITALGDLREATGCRSGFGAEQRLRQLHLRRRRAPALRRARTDRLAHARAYRRLLLLPAARRRWPAGADIHRRHPADPRHRPHRLPERRRPRPVDQPAAPAGPGGRHRGVPRPRLPRLYAFEHRRGARPQPAPAGSGRRGLRGADGRPAPAEPAPDGHRRARQPRLRPLLNQPHGRKTKVPHITN